MSIDVKFGFHSYDKDRIMNRAFTCDFLLEQHERNPFLKRFVIGEKTWILYQNVHRIY